MFWKFSPVFIIIAVLLGGVYLYDQNKKEAFREVMNLCDNEMMRKYQHELLLEVSSRDKESDGDSYYLTTYFDLIDYQTFEHVNRGRYFCEVRYSKVEEDIINFKEYLYND
jgi:hypothetical protein